MSSPDDPTRDDTTQDDPTPGTVSEPFVPHAKIAIPPLPPEFVVRPALRADLDAADPADVALVCAPAGYGKTLLLADWARSSTAADIAWVGLDRDDNDPKRLWASVVAAVAACPSVPADSRLHRPWPWPRATAAQPEFLAELGAALQRLPRPIRLILDDAHELVDPDTLHGLQILTRNRPAGIQLVLSSRLDPPLSLPQLRLTGRLWELRAARMRFSPAEAATLLARSGVHLTPGQLEVLHARTGGWAAGLRLAALAMAKTADRDGFLAHFSSDERPVADHLVEEIISRLPEDLRQFLRVDQHQRPRAVRPRCGAVRPGGRRKRARPARAPDLARRRRPGRGVRSTASRSCCGPTCAPTCTAMARSGWPSCTPRPPAGGPTSNGPSAPWTTPPRVATPRCCRTCCAGSPWRWSSTASTGRCGGALSSLGARGHRIRPVAGPDLGTHPHRGR